MVGGLMDATAQDLCVEISFVQLWNVSVYFLFWESNKYKARTFTATQLFGERAVCGDISTIVLKSLCSSEVFFLKIPHIPGRSSAIFHKRN